ncbi:MAG TPA: LysR family transcriptional regulator, partial [Aliiroseovarius sp.]|nr:LysR family transcriptional regulator [Aliiroseovarius sp.]
VSAALGRLRHLLGDELFFRSGKTFKPTQFALSLESPLRDVLGQVENLITGSDTFDPATSDARLRISGSDFFAEMLMPALTERLQIAAPLMTAQLVNMPPGKSFEALTMYDVDLVLNPEMDLPDWAEEQFLFKSEYCVIARAGHPRLARAGVKPGQVVPLDLFCDIGHVLFSLDGRTKAQGDAALARIGRRRRVVTTLPAFSGVYRVVARSDLIALLPSSLAHHVARTAGLEVFLPPVSLPATVIMMVWHWRMNRDPAHRWLRQQVTELLSDLEEYPG